MILVYFCAEFLPAPSVIFWHHIIHHQEQIAKVHISGTAMVTIVMSLAPFVWCTAHFILIISAWEPVPIYAVI